MKLIMITKDGLECVKDCYNIDETATTLMRPLLREGPTVHETNEWRKTMEYRRYIRTGETENGLPIFREES